MEESNGIHPYGKEDLEDFNAKVLNEIYEEQEGKALIELYDWRSDQWQSSARWVKYEEDAIGDDRHWGRPHIAVLSFHSLTNLRQCFRKGAIILDLDATTFDGIATTIVDAVKRKYSLDNNRAQTLIDCLKRHQHHTGDNDAFIDMLRRLTRKISTSHDDVSNSRSKSTVDFWPQRQHADIEQRANVNDRKRSVDYQRNVSVMSKNSLDHQQRELIRNLPENAEVVKVFAGQMTHLNEMYFAFISLKQACYIPELMQTPLPIRFLIIILGPRNYSVDYHEVGRSVATLMSNPHFYSIANQAKESNELLRGLDEFLDMGVVLPPVDIHHDRVLDAKDVNDALKKFANKSRERHTIERQMSIENSNANNMQEEKKRKKGKSNENGRDPMERVGIPFAGAYFDVKYRLPNYLNDYTSCLHLKCVASVVFVFFAAVAPAITFGGLMGAYTKQSMGITEMVVSQCLMGIFWSVFSAQPLVIVASTGPMLIFETAFFNFCEHADLNFLTMRVWCGIWLCIISVIVVGAEGSFLLKYVTRFTEEIFTSLISFIYIAESLKFMIECFQQHPVDDIGFYNSHWQQCAVAHNISADSYTIVDNPCFEMNQPNTALTTAFLMLATFILAFTLKQLRNMHYFGRQARQFLGDFGVLLSITIVLGIDFGFFSKVHVEKLVMPPSFDYTNRTARAHGLFVAWSLESGQAYAYFIAVIPAFLVYILFYVETEIIEFLIYKREGARKGTGFHWDLLVCVFQVFLSSIFGLPWMCPEAVASLSHCSSLTVMKRHAPGETPKVDYVIENRVTSMCVAILVGACALLGVILEFMPLAILFGVFLYLGAMSLFGNQFMARLLLFAIPRKHHPRESYTELISLKSVYKFTLIQLFCLIVIYVVKHFKQSALAFPFILMLLAALRQLGLTKIFTQEELQALDGHHEESTEDEDFYETQFA